MICQECMDEDVWLWVNNFEKALAVGYCNKCMAPHCLKCGFSHEFSLKGHVCPVGPLMETLEEREK